MKKASILSLFIMILSLFILTSCGQKPTYSGEFTQEEFVMSKNQEIDFFDELNLKGIEKNQVEISLSGDIAEKIENTNTYKMLYPGKAVVTATKDKQTFASAVVIVKDNFSSPTNLTVDENGVVTWDEVYAFYEGELVKASRYTISVNDVEVPVLTNLFVLPAQGVYSIKVKANGSGYFDESEYSPIQVFEYGVMPKVSGVELESNQEFSNGEMTLSWQSVANANYDVYLSGIRIASKIQSTQVGLNLTGLDAGQTVKVDIVVNDARIVDESLKRASSTASFSIVKPYDVNIEHVIDNGEGFLRWRNVVGAKNYNLTWRDANLSTRTGRIDESTFETKNGYVYSSLSGIGEGVYTCQIQAKGGSTNNILYADSNISVIERVAKLRTPQYTYNFADGVLTLDVQKNENSNIYALEINGQSRIIDLTQDSKYQIDFKTLEVGQVQIALKNIPFVKDNIVQDVTISNIISNKVLSSDSATQTFFKLGEIENLKHSLVDGNSVLTFDKIDNADYYEVSINGVKASYVEVDEIANENKTQLTIRNLYEYELDGFDYNFEVTVGRSDGHAEKVVEDKKVSIINTPEKETAQENGYFTWQDLGLEDVEYVYTVYSSDKDKGIGEVYVDKSGKRYENISTKENRTDLLPFGYYVVSMRVKSLNTDLYLDSDFGGKLENNLLQEWFYVSQQIEEPELAFELDKDQYKLTIKKVEFANVYDIYLDGIVIGTLSPTDETKEEYVYRFANDVTFEDNNGNRKDYSIKVVARVNQSGDSVLHPNSNASELTIARLEQATFNVDEDEKLVVNIPEGVDYVEIVRGGNIVNLDKKPEISLKDFVGNVDVGFRYKALSRQGNVVYLDSQEKTYTFKRLATSSDVSFNNGVVSFTNENKAEVARYDIKLTLVNSENGNYEKIINSDDIAFDVDLLQFNLNNYLESMRSDDEFYTAYSQCSEILVAIRAYRFGYIEDGEIFYLPSAYSNNLSLNKLDAPTISFDTANLSLSWQVVGGVGTTSYSIYIDGARVAGITGNVYSLSSLNFITGKEITVYAENSAYLSSARSNIVVIRKLSPISSFNLSNTNARLSSIISANDLEQVSVMSINNIDIAKPSSGEIIINLTDYASNDYTIHIYLKGVAPYTQGGKTYYYISSDARNYKFYDIGAQTVSLEKNDEGLSWTALGSDFAGQNGNPLSYQIIVKNLAGQQLDVIENITENEMSFDDPRIYNLAEGDYVLQVQAVIKDYTISSGTSGAVGYFGNKDFGSKDVTKVKALPEDYTYSVVSANSSNPFEKRMKGELVIKWKNVWGSVKPKFDINMSTGNSTLDGLLKNLEDGSDAGFLGMVSGYDFSLNLVGEYYEFKLNNKVLTDFFAESGYQDVPVIVHTSGNIKSNSQDVTIRRLATASNLALSGNGILTFDSVYKASSYIVALTMPMDENPKFIQTTQTSVDLWSDNPETGFKGIKNYTGEYRIQVLADAESMAMPASAIGMLEGYRMIGAKDVVVEGSGNVKITLVEADEEDKLSFEAIYNGTQREFEPTYNEVDKTYNYGTNEFVKLFDDLIDKRENTVELNIEIVVKREGNVNSAEKEFSFLYKQEDEQTLMHKRGSTYIDGKVVVDKTKDYLAIFGDVDETTGLWIEYKYLGEVEDENGEVSTQEITVKLPLGEDGLKGFWVTRPDGSEGFSLTEPSTGSAVPCFALDVTSLISDLGVGAYTFYISRITNVGGVVSQYGEAQIEFDKLDGVVSNTVRLTDENLMWTGVDSENVSGYIISFYNYVDGKRVLENSVEVYTATIYDLTQIMRTASGRRYITISTISIDEGVIVSNPTIDFEIGRYSTPNTLEVKDGILRYAFANLENIQLLQDIRANQSNFTNLGERLATTTYTEPFMFTASTIDSMNVRLEFRDVVTGKVYYATMKAVDLLASELRELNLASAGMTYIELLGNAVTYLQSQGSAYYLQVRNLYNSLVNSTYGLANSQKLFDDHGNEIPAGHYEVSLRQEGTALDQVNHQGMLPSIYSDFTALEVAETPSIKLGRERNGVTNIYYLSFKPSKITRMSSGGQKEVYTATEYIINLRMRGSSAVKEYTIRNLASLEDENPDWRLYYFENGEEKYFTLRTDIEEGYVSIDLTNDFAKKLDIDESERQVSIYAVGNDYALNSKTDTINMSLLKFDYTSLGLNNGVLSWTSGSPNGTLVSYKHIYSMDDQEVITRNSVVVAGERQQTISLPSAGRYEYIMFMSLGSFSYNTVVVDSESYMIRNLYKRYEPNVSVANGVFTLSNNISEDLSYADFMQFEVGNSASRQTYMTEARKVANNRESIQYLPGQRNNEQEANQFSFASVGSTISNSNLTLNTYMGDEADFVLTLPEDSALKFILSSSSYSVNAKMLAGVNNAVFKQGNLDWSDYVEDELADGFDVVYRVNVYHYDEEAHLGTGAEKALSTFYTLQKSFMTKYIQSVNNSPYLSISVTAIGCAVVTSETIGAIETIKGEYITLPNARFGDIYNSYALTSVETNYGERNIQKIAQVESARISGQAIEIKYPGHVQKDYLHANLPALIDIEGFVGFKIFDDNGNEILGKLYGSDLASEYYTNTLEDDGRKVTYVWFVPDEGQLTFEQSPYKFSVYAYPTEDTPVGSIYSDPVVMRENVYKLKELASTDLTFNYDIDNDLYTLDFSRYFENVQVAGSSNYLQIQVIVDGLVNEENQQVIISVGAQSPRLVIKKGEEISNIDGILTLKENTKVSFKIVANGTSAINAYLENVGEDIIFTQGNFTEEDKREDSNGDKVNFKWNVETKTFTWTCGKTADGYDFNPNNEYIVRVVFSNSAEPETSDIIKATSAEGLYYQPRRAGNITQVSVYVRSGGFALFSEPLTLYGKPYFDFNLFESGLGTESDPYRISTIEHFKNIAQRNTVEGDYHFRLTSDIEGSLEIGENFIVDGTFYGHLDGNGHTINLKISGSKALAQQTSQSLPSVGVSTTDVTFENGVALFGQVGTNAIVEKLKVNLSVNISNIEANTVIAPITLTNYGIIQNIELQSVDSALALGRVSQITVAFAGMVGDNYGTIDNCVNSASFDYSVNATGNIEPYMLYSGIAIMTARIGGTVGVMSNCFSTGNVTVTARKNYSILWGSGIVANISNARIFNCGNDGDITIQGNGTSNYTAYLAGVTLRANSNETRNYVMQYCYNNGTLSIANNQTTIGGIAYNIQGGSVRGLVETSGRAIANMMSSVTGDSCYANEGSQAIDVLSLIDTTLNTASGDTLVIAQNGNTFKASIVYKQN